MQKLKIAAILMFMTTCSIALAEDLSDEDFSYADVAKRYNDTQLDAKSVKEAKMQGECLVGLKHLNFRKRQDFDPVAEWTSFRAFSLLEQYSPCRVLIIMEVARKELLGDS